MSATDEELGWADGNGKYPVLSYASHLDPLTPLLQLF